MPTADAIDAPPAITNRLRKLGLERREDLLLHLPLRYEDETRITAIAPAPPASRCRSKVQLLDLSLRPAPRRQLVLRVCDARPRTAFSICAS
jgi:ATP-dependent DNA helicase RecG